MVITSSSVSSAFFVLPKYPRINAIAPRINRIANPIQKKEGAKKASAKNMTNPETERTVSSKNFIVTVLPTKSIRLFGHPENIRGQGGTVIEWRLSDISYGIVSKIPILLS